MDSYDPLNDAQTKEQVQFELDFWRSQLAKCDVTESSIIMCRIIEKLEKKLATFD